MPTVHEVEEDLRALAERTGEVAYLRAANALHQQRAGRPAANDRRLIEEVHDLVQSGEVPSLNRALRQVARTVPGQNPRSVAERLRRKIAAEMQNSSTK